MESKVREKVDNTTNTALCFLEVTFQLKVLQRGGDKVNIVRTKLANISLLQTAPECIQYSFANNPLAKQLIYVPLAEGCQYPLIAHTIWLLNRGY
jgi:hypothetical protein